MSVRLIGLFEAPWCVELSPYVAGVLHSAFHSFSPAQELESKPSQRARLFAVCLPLGSV